MGEIFGKNYYIDIEKINEKCKTGSVIKNEDGSEILEINLFKYEIIKVCLERVLNEYEDTDNDNDLSAFTDRRYPISFNIAFNTLIKNDILIEEDE